MRNRRNRTTHQGHSFISASSDSLFPVRTHLQLHHNGTMPEKTGAAATQPQPQRQGSRNSSNDKEAAISTAHQHQHQHRCLKESPKKGKKKTQHRRNLDHHRNYRAMATPRAHESEDVYVGHGFHKRRGLRRHNAATPKPKIHKTGGT